MHIVWHGRVKDEASHATHVKLAQELAHYHSKLFTACHVTSESLSEFYVAGAVGIEPTSSLLEREMLPLHQAPKLSCQSIINHFKLIKQSFIIVAD